mgnify:CR=1 FL=1
MEIKVNSYRKQSTLISSIVFFIIGGILFTNPDIFVTTISKIVGASKAQKVKKHLANY